MTSYQTYSLVLSIVVFAILTATSALVITIIYKQKRRLIINGVEDNQIVADFQKKKENKGTKIDKLSRVLNIGLTLIIVFVLLVAFIMSTYVGCTEKNYSGNLPVYRVVKTDSMATKHPKNTYLVDNNLDNQFRSMDLIATYKLPAEQDLKLYDIVVYEVDGILLVHRIVKIEEPNASHPNERHFMCQGDAVDSPDRFPVLYSQMRAIYKGEKVPFVGSFVLFLQSPAGWLCILLVVVGMVVAPILDKTLDKHKQQRVQFVIAKQEEKENKERRKFDFSSLKKQKAKTFENRMFALRADTYIRYDIVYKYLTKLDNVKEGKSKTIKAFMLNGKAIAKLVIKGKSVVAYIAIDPQKLQGTKYKVNDASSVKKYANCPTAVKLTSLRQAKWSCELIDMAISNVKGGVV